MEGKDQYLLYLPSSVPSFQKNTPSQYQTQLNNPIELDEHVQYEAALLKIMHPPTADNVYDGTITFKSYTEKGAVRTVHFKRGFYNLPNELIAAFSKAVEGNERYYALTCGEDQKFRLEVRHTTARNPPYLSLSKNLQLLTGLPETIEKAGNYVAARPFDARGGLHNVFVYCNLIDLANVGNTVAPILSVFNMEDREYEAKVPIYMPIRQKRIENIVVELRTQAGMLFPFRDTGETTCVIKIRMKNILD